MSKILFCQFIGFIKDDKIERYTMLFFSYKIHTKYMYLNSFLSFQVQLILSSSSVPLKEYKSNICQDRTEQNITS